MVVSNGVEVHGCVSVRGERTARTDGHGRDVGGVEHDLRPEINVVCGAGIKRSVGVSGVWCSDDDPCLMVADGHAGCAQIKPQPPCRVDVDHGR